MILIVSKVKIALLTYLHTWWKSRFAWPISFPCDILILSMSWSLNDGFFIFLTWYIAPLLMDNTNSVLYGWIKHLCNMSKIYSSVKLQTPMSIHKRVRLCVYMRSYILVALFNLLWFGKSWGGVNVWVNSCKKWR